jgi:ADP-heptose:LPS heptosyltransferase
MRRRTNVVVNFTRAGDLIQSRYMLRAIKERYPDEELVLVTLPAFAPTAQCIRAVDSVLIADADAWLSALHAPRADLSQAIKLIREFANEQRLSNIRTLHNMSHTPQSAYLCGALAAQSRYGLVTTDRGRFSCRGRWYHYLLSVIRERKHNAFNLVDVFTRCADGYAALASESELKIDDATHRQAETLLTRHGLSAHERFVVFIPGASASNRQWPTEHFADVASQLKACGYRTIITGGQGEASLGESIARQSREAAASLCGSTDINVLVALLKRANLVIGNDTGPLHMAAALGTPTLGLYIGPAAAKDTAPYGEGHVILQPIRASGPCDYRTPCVTCDCRYQIPPALVIKCARALLAGQQCAPCVDKAVAMFETQINTSGDLEIRNVSQAMAGDDAATHYRSFWNYALDAVGDAFAPRSAARTQTSVYYAQLGRRLVEVLEQVKRNPLLLSSYHFDNPPALDAATASLACSFVNFLKVRMELIPHRSEAYLNYIDETIEIMVRAAEWLLECEAPANQSSRRVSVMR